MQRPLLVGILLATLIGETQKPEPKAWRMRNKQQNQTSIRQLRPGPCAPTVSRRPKARRRLLTAGGLLAVLSALVMLFACKAPSFPLPPPDPNQLQIQPYSSDGFMVMSGSADVVEPRSEVHVFNESKGFGYYFYAGDDGSFTSPPMAADEGDHIQFFYVSNGNSSRPLCFLVDYSQSPPPTCQ